MQLFLFASSLNSWNFLPCNLKGAEWIKRNAEKTMFRASNDWILPSFFVMKGIIKGLRINEIIYLTDSGYSDKDKSFTVSCAYCTLFYQRIFLKCKMSLSLVLPQILSCIWQMKASLGSIPCFIFSFRVSLVQWCTNFIFQISCVVLDVFNVSNETKISLKSPPSKSSLSGWFLIAQNDFNIPSLPFSLPYYHPSQPYSSA